MNNVIEAAQGWLARLESLLKIAAGLLVLVAGMGVPAVYAQYRNYGIPPDFITYGEVLRAGAIPSVLLTLVAIYLAWVTRKALGIPDLEESPIISLLLLPILLPLITTFLATLILWSLGGMVLPLLVLAQAVRAGMRVIGHSPTQQQLLYLTFLAFVILALASPSLNRLLLRKLMPRLMSLQARMRNVRSIKNFRSRNGDWDERAFLWWWTAGAIVLFPLGSVSCLILLRTASRTWLPQYATAVTNGRIAAVALTTALMVLLFFTVFYVGRMMGSEDKLHRKNGVWLAAGTVVLGYLLCAVLYSTRIYPTLWRGLGGGRPTPVTVWLEEKSLTSSLRNATAGVSFRSEGQVVRCDGLLLLQSSSDWFIFVGGTRDRQGLVVPRSAITMLAF